MAIFNNKVNFLFFWTLELSDGHLQQQGELSRLPPLRQGDGLHNTQTMAMNTSVISEYDHTYDIQLIDTQNSWAFLNITDTDDDVNDAEMMIVHSNQHKQSTQSTHLGL